MSAAKTPPEKQIINKPQDADPKTISVSEKTLTIDDLGWTKAEAVEIRQKFAVFAEDWDDPAMDVYNDL